MLGALIGMAIGLVIVAIISATKQSKAREHAVSVRKAIAAGGEAGRSALDKRLPARRALMQDADVEGQAERLAALAALGDLDAVAAETAAYTGSTLHVANARAVGRLALALAGRDPQGQLAAHRDDVAALEAAGTNRLSLRAVAAFVPVLGALAGQNTLDQAARDEVLRFQGRDAVKKLIRDAFARIDASPSAGT